MSSMNTCMMCNLQATSPPVFCGEQYAFDSAATGDTTATSVQSSVLGRHRENLEAILWEGAKGRRINELSTLSYMLSKVQRGSQLLVRRPFAAADRARVAGYEVQHKCCVSVKHYESVSFKGR